MSDISISFMVYGPVSKKDMAVIAYAIYDEMGLDGRLIIENVDAEMAEVFNVSRGWNIQWLFDSSIDPEPIVELIEEGLEHLKLEYKFYGVLGGENSV
jgi:hypothetical protein